MKGIYVLVISVEQDFQVNVGTLGILRFEKGLYAYVGSAQNCLEKRVRRHLGKNKKKFWHIDYLLDNSGTKILQVYHRDARRPEECKIAQELSKKGSSMAGFGSSDCKCESHLFKIEDYDFLSKGMSKMVV